MENTKPLVSIIIPTYNGSTYIEDAIKSCQDQTYSNYEILIIDDGSTDNTKKVINNYLSNKKCRYIYQENAGLAAARNTGLRISAGSYIQFLDSDDLIIKSKLAKQVDFLESNSQFFGVYCDTVYFNHSPENQIESYRKFEIRSGVLLNRFITSNFIPVNAMLIRKPQITFDENLNVSEDWDFWLRLSLEGKSFSSINEKLNYVRIHDSNMSKNRKKMLSGELVVLEKLEKYLPENGKLFLAKFKRYRKLKEYETALFNLYKSYQLDKKYWLKYYKYKLKYMILKKL